MRSGLNLFPFQIIILIITHNIVQCFQFRAPSVSCAICTINQVSSYYIQLARSLDAGLGPTPYNSQAVPSGSNISITFPTQFTLTGTETCSDLIIDGNSVATYSCTVTTTTNTITITGAISSNIFIASVSFTIGGVKNPSSAVTSSPFTAKIGSDTSSNDSSGSVSLLPGELKNLVITFDPNTVNTTGNMIISAVISNSVPANGTIRVYFPTSLRWAQEISPTNTLPLTSTMTCSALNANIKYTLACSGSTSAQTVSITNAFPSALPANTAISFSINNLFSPPTTESIDSITVTTYTDAFASAIDSLSSTITGLTPKSFSLTISSPNSLIINSNVGLQFAFTLPDTISRSDYLVITFPSGTNFTYNTSLCPQLSINTSNISYSSSTSQLRIWLTTSSPNRNAGLNVLLTVLTYYTPSSARTVGPIFLRIMNNNGIKAEGSSSITILPKSYTGSVVTANTTVNAQTSYTITFSLADAISSTGYFIVRFPAQLTTSGSLSVSITGPSIASNPTIQYINSSSIKLSNLNSSSSNIVAQNLTIVISGLIQPSSVKTISSFIVQIYFSNANDLVAQATTTSTIVTTPGSLISAQVNPASLITAANTDYSFSISIANSLPSNSRVIVTVPSAITIISGGTCKLQSTTISCSSSGSTITFVLSSSVTAGSTLLLSYSQFTNPSSTRPTGNFGFSTTNSAGQIIDTLSTNSSVFVTMVAPSALTSVSFSRNSKQNSFVNTYSFSFTQVQAITQSSAIIVITFPTQITFSSPTCSTGSTALTCTQSSNTISIQFAPTPSPNTPYSLTITGIKNPISYKPSPSIAISTRTSDNLYTYSAISTGLEVVNNLPSSFKALAFGFSNQVLSQSGDLTIDVTNQDTPSYFVVQFAPSFGVNASSSIACISPSFTTICTLFLNNVTNLYSLKVQSTSTIPTTPITIKISSLHNPPTIPSDYTWLSSYTADNYLISENKNTIQFTTYCTFPCRQCNTTARSLCLSCYSPTSNVTNRVYLHQQQCLQSCPSGYIPDSSTYTCIACTAPCLTCQSFTTYCTSCNTSTAFKYLKRTITTTTNTSTCVSQCPVEMYPDLTQVPALCVSCVSPCRQCTTSSECVTCVDGYFLYNVTCLATCPALVTVPINSTCYNCTSNCVTCSVSVSNCTSCAGIYSLYNNTCITTCPSSMISLSNICTSCQPKCLTCSVTTSNCTSCNTSSTVPYFYSFDCIDICPNFYFPDTFKKCQSCENLNRGCKNCSSPTICLSCDPGYVLLNSNCLNFVPDGYLNISGVAVPCQGDCETCSLALTNCTSCKTLSLFQNACKSVCPAGTVALNKTCRACAYPCSQCTNTTSKCTKCATNSSLYLYNTSCVSATSCPDLTYPQSLIQICANCVQPCNLCNSTTICLSCITGYFLVNQTSSCETSCPPGSVGINRICMACISPCQTCIASTTKCQSCIANYYYNPFTFQCLSTCPSGQIANQTTLQCQNCVSPCKTCINTTDTCLSCVLGTYLSNNLCVKVCPAGQYGVSGLCKNCQNNCSTCSSAVHCLSCQTPLVLYSAKCLQSCPVTHSLVSNDSVCISCTTVVPSCSNCSINGQCYSCYSPSIYFNGNCLSSCPQGYKYLNFTCQPNNQTDIILNQSLQSYTFPIPFTILSCVIFIACCMSKLQNYNTYFIGTLYSLFGMVETGCLAYLIYQYFVLGPAVYNRINLYILLAVAAFIYVLNVLALLIQSPYLVNYDRRFSQWLKSDNKSFFSFITIFSVVVNYKIKMILFSRLFKFHSMCAFLENIYRFRLFNIFSFFGILPEALALYVCFVSIVNYTFQKLIFHAFLDVIVIFIINILLAILIVWKPDNFFHQETEDGFSINKKITANGDDFSKQAILCDQFNDQTRQQGPDSYLVFARSPFNHIEQQKVEISSTQNQNELKKNTKVYFANNAQNQSSNPFRKQTKLDKIQRIAEQNIFGDVEHYSENGVQNFNQYQLSSAGGSEQVVSKLSPRSPKKHATIVVGGNDQNVKTNLATQNQDIGKRISQREKQLDELKRQLQQQESARKQKRKSRKKLKKSIQIEDGDPQYEQISIKDSSNKQKTQQDSNMKTMEQPKNNNLNAEEKQSQIEEDFKDIPKQTLGSWMELRIAQENRKLPVFNQALPNNNRTISIDQSQPNLLNQEIKNQKQQNLAFQQKLSKIQYDLQDMKSKQKQKQKQKNEVLTTRKGRHNNFQFEQQNSKQFSQNDIQNNEKNLQANNNNSTIKQKQKQKQKENDNHKNNKLFQYDQKLLSQLNESEKPNGQEKKQFQFQQESKDYDQRAGTRLNFQNLNKDNQDQQFSLEDSRHEDEKINERPFSAANKNKIKNSQALLQILAKSERQRMNSRGTVGAHRITQQDQIKNSGEGKPFKLSGGPIKSQQVEEQAGQQFRKSRMYMAGLNQFHKQGQQKLNRKKTMNYPLQSMNKKSVQDSELSNSFNQIQNSRNKSHNAGLNRKYVSKDLSGENIDDLGMQYTDYKKNYEQLMNERYAGPGSQRKPGTSGTARSSNPMNSNVQSIPIYRRSNFNRGNSKQMKMQDQSLNNYYRKQQSSIDKKEKRDRMKNKSLSKQKSLEETKRIKQLQRIYLSKN